MEHTCDANVYIMSLRDLRDPISNGKIDSWLQM